MKKRLFTLVLAMCMTLTGLPSFVFAAGFDNTDAAADTTETTIVLEEDAAGDTDTPADATEAEPEDTETVDPEDENGDVSDTDETVEEPEATDTDSEQAETETQPEEEPESKPKEEPKKAQQAPPLKAGNSVSYTAWHTSDGTTVFSASIGGTSMAGTCCQRGVAMASSGTGTYSAVSNSHNAAKIVYHYGIEAGWWDGAASSETARYVLGLNYDTSFTKKNLVEDWCQIAYQGASAYRSAAINIGGYNANTADAIINTYNSINFSSISIPKGFTMYHVDAGSDQDFVLWNYTPVPPTGKLTLTKTASTPVSGITTSLSNYSLTGAEYRVYTDSACTVRAKDVDGTAITLTTKSNGKTNTVTVSPGKYWAKEVTASPGFRKDTNVNGGRSVTVSEDGTATFTSTEVPTYGMINFQLYKKSDLQISEEERDKLVGAQYKLSYYDIDPSSTSTGSASATRSWTFETRLPTEAEIEAARTSGYELSTATIIDFSKDTPVSGSSFYTDSSGKRALPIGVFTIKEIKAPAGYAKNKETYYGKVYQASNGAAAKTVHNTKDSDTLIIENNTRLINPDDKQHPVIAIQKLDAETEEAEAQGFGSLAGAEFDVYYGEVSEDTKVGTIVTDEDGKGSLAEDTEGNQLDFGKFYVVESKASPGYVVNEEVMEIETAYEGDDEVVFTFSVDIPETPHTTEFSKVDITDADKELPGATLQIIDAEGEILEEWESTDEIHTVKGLPDGEYTLREITSPYGFECAEDVSFEIKGDEVQTKVTMENKPIEIGTTATDSETGTHTGTFSEKAKIIDTVKYENLAVGKTYVVTGTLMDKATGEPLLDKEGNPVTAETTFTPEGEKEGQLVSGSVDVVFEIDTSEFEIGTQIVAFESLSRDDRELAIHADINDDDQTVNYGRVIGTVATNELADIHIVAAGDDAVIIDTVSYEGLTPGETYVMKGELYDKTTGKLTGIKAEKEFTVKDANGTVQVEFKFDATDYAGHDLVVYEYLTQNDVEIDKHEDPNDEDQTVKIPDIGTTVADKAVDGYVTDTVRHENLISGEEYIMRGYAVRYDSGAPVDGFTGETRFTADDEDGSVDVKLKNIEGSGNVVIFEECYIITDDGDEIIVGEHKDLNDESQLFKKTGKIVIDDKDKFKGVKTGDSTMLALWLGIFALAGAAFVTGAVRVIRRRRSGEE